MQLDFTKTLLPQTGLSRQVYVEQPDQQHSVLWTVVSDIGQSVLRSDSQVGDFDLTLVGAADLKLNSALIRGAGEAVERYALMPGPQGPQPQLHLVDIDGGLLWNPCLHGMETWCYQAAPILSPEAPTVSIPAGAVDYPFHSLRDDDGMCDPGPSGASSGAGLTDAIERACKELLERDAAMRAWDEKDDTRVRFFSVNDSSLRDHRLATLLQACERLKLEVITAVLPITGTTETSASMTMIVDTEGRLAAAGLGLERSYMDGAVRSLQEALQVRAFLLNIVSQKPPQTPPPPLPLADDRQRSLWWASHEGIAAAQRWQDWVRSCPTTGGLNTSFAGTWSSCVGAAYTVNLSARLPAAIQDLGWNAVKVIAPELVPLRMSEAVTWNRHSTFDSWDGLPMPQPFI